MRTRDLVAERRAASEAMTRRDVAELVQYGVPSAAIEIFNMVGVARVNRVADTCLYQPDQDGVWAFVTPVLVDDPAGPESRLPEAAALLGTIVDLVAWDPEHPTDWALRAGRAVWLGSVAPQYLDPEPVWVRRTVLDWFCAGCTNLVVLARDTAQAYSLLMGFPNGIYAEDEHHKAHLEEMLKRPWQLPPVVIGPRLQREVPRAAG